MKSHILAFAFSLAAAAASLAQPAFLYEPVERSASLGANVTLFSLAYGPEPIAYQWYKDDAPLAGEDLEVLVLNGLNASHAGFYFVVASSDSGSVTSQVARLTVDLAFTKVTSGGVLNEGAFSYSGVWGDYDNDGFLDLFVANGGTDFNYLFHNTGTGTFTRVTTGIVASDLANTFTGLWGDYDNDGWLDLFLVNDGNGSFATDILYHNNADGTFAKVTNTVLTAEGRPTSSAAWGDYDRDGYLDLLTVSSDVQFQAPNRYYRNNGNGTFSPGIGLSIGSEFAKISTSAAWVDFNDDNNLDIAVGNQSFMGILRGSDFLYTNNGNGTFGSITNGPIYNAGGNSLSISWADYDGDGRLDLFVANIDGENNFLFANSSSNVFRQITAGELVNDGGDSIGAAWADYDNDGWLDLFVANFNGENNFLYHNNGHGTFTRITTGSLVNDGGNSAFCAWGDYDNNGFADLFVANLSGDNFLYRNNGNSNGWIKVRLVGGASNRWGVGAKVKALATIGGVTRWQLREIAARDGTGSPNTLLAEFGLGDATHIELLRIEWPSGLVQEMENVSLRQLLTVVEPPYLRIGSSSSVSEGDAGMRTLTFNVFLSQPTNTIVTVDFYTADVTALGGTDYIATNGTLLFGPNETNKTISIGIIGDLIDETNETFSVTLSNSIVYPIVGARGLGTIIDDDPLAIDLLPIQAVEGNTGTTQAQFSVTLNKPWDILVTVDYTNGNAVAVAGVDYAPTGGRLTFNPGETTQTISVTIFGDVVNEPNELFFMNLSNVQPTNTIYIHRQSVCTIVNDDPLPALSIDNVSVVEGDSGTTQAVFRVTLSGPSSSVITVNYGTTNGTATSGSDYVAKNSSLSFPALTTTQTLFIVVTNEMVPEANETFFVGLSSPVNAVLGNSVGTGTILDDDHQITLVDRVGGNIRFRFTTINGRNYRVDWCEALGASAVWIPLASAGSVAGTGGVVEVVDPDGTPGPQRFYRVVLLSP